MTYTAPLADMRFALREVAGLERIAALPGYEHATDDTVDAVLEEAAKLAGNGLAPLNRDGDKVGARLENGVVRTAPGFTGIYKEFVDGGWNSLPFDPEFGGQGMPWLLATTVQEMWQAANMGFGLVLLLNQGAIDAIHHHGSAEQKATYLPRMISGEWTGTMNLTEPQAGSDLSVMRTRAEPAGDGSYRISGEKIYITWGEHDLTDNIIHFVLARLPDAPPGNKGISLFLVPKFLLKPDGTPGERNDARAHSIEHKMGIHASPTCTMVYGDNGGAVGYLVGEENRGLACMFTMMNLARLAVGLQGVGIAERATQQAIQYAKDRKQGRSKYGAKAKSQKKTKEGFEVTAEINAVKMSALTNAARYSSRFAQKRAKLLAKSPNPRSCAAHRGACVCSNGRTATNACHTAVGDSENARWAFHACHNCVSATRGWGSSASA